MVHDEWRSSCRVDVVQRRLGRTVATRVARVVHMFAVGGAARVAAVLRVVATASVGVRRVSHVLGRQETRLCADRNLHHALALQQAWTSPPELSEIETETNLA